jgi:hypothetical protein
MSNINLTPEQVQKLGSHLQKEAANDFEVRPLAPPSIPTAPPIMEQPRQPVYAPTREPVYTPTQREAVSTGSSLEDRIKKLEAEYKGGMSPVSQDESLKTSYLDEYNRDTFYVKNISGNHVHAQISSDPNVPGILIKKGTVANLLDVATVEECYVSKDLRKLTSGFAGDPPALKRITPEEYADEMERYLLTQRKIEELKAQEAKRQQYAAQGQAQSQAQQNMPFNNPASRREASSKLNYKIVSKIEKLRLSTDPDPENAQWGISSTEFIQWMWQEFLSDEDLDYILGDPISTKFPDVKHAAIEKKTIK